MGDSTYQGLDEIRSALERLLSKVGTLVGKNVYCLAHADIALLRADYIMNSDEGGVMMRGSSAEIVRRGDDGTWRYIVDHATGASLAPEWPL